MVTSNQAFCENAERQSNCSTLELDNHTPCILRQRQRREKDKWRHVGITVILMLDGLISVEDICQTFGIDSPAVYRYAEKYGKGQETQRAAELRHRLYRTAA